MGFLKIFSGKDPEEYEQKGDVLFENEEYGPAKMEYEAALSKAEKKFSDKTDLKDRLQQKITQTKNALALRHKQIGEELMDMENYDDAEEKFRLARELAEDPELQIELEEKLQEIQTVPVGEAEDSPEFDLRQDDVEEPDYQDRLDEYFTALCASLPEQMTEVYQGYGNDFKIGFVALNQGDFEKAVDKLSQAMKEDTSSESFIPMELAKAHLNLKQYKKTRSLLEEFLKEHPDSLQGIQLLCETYWEIKEYDLAQELLTSCPQEIKNTLPIRLLQGETLFQAGKYKEAESLYLNHLKSSGWNEHIAHSLALTYDALGEKEKARDLLEEIMEECRGCGFRVDSSIKQQYADLCFEAGQYSAKIVELYISLVHEDPGNKAYYYQKISQIYSAQGNENEARRYQVFAQKSKDKKESE